MGKRSNLIFKSYGLACFVLVCFFQTSHLLTKLSSWENKHWKFPKEVNPCRVGRDPESPTAPVAKGVLGLGEGGLSVAFPQLNERIMVNLLILQLF